MVYDNKLNASHMVRDHRGDKTATKNTNAKPGDRFINPLKASTSLEFLDFSTIKIKPKIAKLVNK